MRCGSPRPIRGRNRDRGRARGLSTDLHVVQGIVRHGAGRWSMRAIDGPDELDAALGDDVAAVLLSHADYRSSYRLDMAAVDARVHATSRAWCGTCRTPRASCRSTSTATARLRGRLHLQVPERRSRRGRARVDPAVAAGPRLAGTAGWLGHADRMHFQGDYAPAPGVLSLVGGTMPVLQNAVTDTAARIFARIPAHALWARHRSLSRTLVRLIDERLAPLGVELVSPRDDERRGGHVAFRTPGGGAVCEALVAAGVIGSFREPDVIRFGLAPVTLSHVDLWDAVDRLRTILEEGRWRAPEFAVVSV
jgi:kynureninase